MTAAAWLLLAATWGVVTLFAGRLVWRIARVPRPAAPPSERHPPALWLLGAVELWERFGFYVILTLLTFFLTEHHGLRTEQAGLVYGGYLGLVYFTPVAGGLLADRRLGRVRAIALGGALLLAGYALLALPGGLALTVGALFVVTLGNGLFKPNISALVGGLYPAGSRLQDAAFSLFYVAINVGAFLAPIAAVALRRALGFHAAFGVAAAGLAVSLGLLGLGRRWLPRPEEARAAHPSEGRAPGPPDERRRMAALLLVFAIVIVFWMAYNQNGFALSLWARDHTTAALFADPGTYQTCNPFFILAFTPLLVALWRRLGARGREPGTPAKMSFGMAVTALAFGVMALAGRAGGDQGRVSPAWLVGAYAVLTVAELCVSPMGLSFVAKIAPPRRRGLLMGGWFAAAGLGGYLSGAIGFLWARWPHSGFFLFLAGAALVAALLLRAALPLLRRATAGLYGAVEANR